MSVLTRAADGCGLMRGLLDQSCLLDAVDADLPDAWHVASLTVAASADCCYFVFPHIAPVLVLSSCSSGTL